jgi:hypothetical protein
MIPHDCSVVHEPVTGARGFSPPLVFFGWPIIAFWNVCLNCRGALEWGVTDSIFSLDPQSCIE